MNDVNEKIIDALATSGCYIGESIFDHELTSRLLARARALREANELSVARVGRAASANGASRETAIRSDATRWLDDKPSDAAERDAANTVNSLRVALNETLFIGAQATELHFAHYAPGAFYKTHRDRFADDDARIVSLVFYLNEDWPDDAGGELVIYGDVPSETRALHRVSPRAGTMVAFTSERFPHEVLPGSRHRFSLTGWLRRAGFAAE
jgi:SM-20-related protein